LRISAGRYGTTQGANLLPMRGQGYLVDRGVAVQLSGQHLRKIRIVGRSIRRVIRGSGYFDPLFSQCAEKTFGSNLSGR
jgi:hypothetical protein